MTNISTFASFSLSCPRLSLWKRTHICISWKSLILRKYWVGQWNLTTQIYQHINILISLLNRIQLCWKDRIANISWLVKFFLKEWTSFTIQNARQVLPHNFVHLFQRQFHIHLGYETLSFLVLEQYFQLSLLDENFRYE